MKKSKKISIRVLSMALCCVMMFMVAFSGVGGEAFASEENVNMQETIHEFKQANQSVVSERNMTDFDGNKFTVYELFPSGYAIFSDKVDSSIFIEGSYEANSPYSTHTNDDIYYLGPGEYFYKDGNKAVNIITEQEMILDQINFAYEIKAEHYIIEESIPSTNAIFPSKPDSDKTHNEDGFVMINNDLYFRILSEFPENSDGGTCGLVAICMLLGYFDTYVDLGFITDRTYKNGHGTTQALHDYLFDKCMHEIPFPVGHPMAGLEIKNTMVDYLKNKCSATLRNKVKHEWGQITYTHENPKRHINAGFPTILVMTSYTASHLPDAKKKFHDVVAYGYDSNDRFLVHMGWDPGNDKYPYSSIIVSNATIHSYYTIDYTA